MTNYTLCLTLGIVLYYLVCSVLGQEICSHDDGTIFTTYKYCEDGYYCCNNDTECCANLSTAAIVGIVIGAIIFIAIVVGLCAVCVNGLGNKGSSGNVITPNTGGQMQVISTGYVQPPGGSGAVYPPNGGYGAPGVQATPGQPPAYGPTSSAAFPPPAPAYSGEKAQ